jgi:hypothetical protein
VTFSYNHYGFGRQPCHSRLRPRHPRPHHCNPKSQNHRPHQSRSGEGLHPGLPVRYIKSFNSPPGQIRKRGGFKHRNRFFPVSFPLLSQQIFWHFRGRLTSLPGFRYFIKSSLYSIVGSFLANCNPERRILLLDFCFVIYLGIDNDVVL